MLKTIRLITILTGTFFIVNAIVLAVTINFNLGIILVGAFGVMLLLYGALLNKLKAIKFAHILFSLIVSVVIIFSSFLAVYGNNDNVTYDEKSIIVLGCGINGEKVGYSLSKRLDKSIEYHRNNPESVIIVSGGQGSQEAISEALAMKRYLVEKGIDEETIILEDKSTSTITNFKYSHEKMKEAGLPDDSVVIVTNSYHIYRATSYAKAEGLQVNHIGADILWYTIPMSYFREILAVVKMWVLD